MIDTSPPAFPFAAEYGHPAATGGMTLRDYFAGQALAGLLATNQDFHDNDGDGWDWHARAAYAMANAMLIERERKE